MPYLGNLCVVGRPFIIFGDNWLKLTVYLQWFLPMSCQGASFSFQNFEAHFPIFSVADIISNIIHYCTSCCITL